MKKIKCDNINYRKGFVEVASNIHKGFINVETWTIDPDFNIEKFKFGDDILPDGTVTGITEIELSRENAMELVKLLQEELLKLERN